MSELDLGTVQSPAQRADKICPLCFSSGVNQFWQDKRRQYYLCDSCHLVFVPARFHLSEQLEKAEYDLHENNLQDPGYLQFLSRVAQPLLDRISCGKGLDFGCGPAPALASLLERGGLEVVLYDKFYYCQPEVLQENYDFITATEVVEHLGSPGKTLNQLWQQLNVSGHMGLMTKRWDRPKRFYSWHYKNDPTHICFFHELTFEWLASKFQAELEVVGPDVVFLRKVGN